MAIEIQEWEKLPEIERQQELGEEVVFRADAAFCQAGDLRDAGGAGRKVWLRKVFICRAEIAGSRGCPICRRAAQSVGDSSQPELSTQAKRI
jgi:hypothetical protein